VASRNDVSLAEPPSRGPRAVLPHDGSRCAWTISAATQRSQSDYNLFERTGVTGSPEVVLLRGNVRFVRRACFGEELKPARAAVAP